VSHPLPEVLLLVGCGTIYDCDDYAGIAACGKTHLPLLRRFLPYHHGVPGARWLTILMNRIDPRTSFAISSNDAESQTRYDKTGQSFAAMINLTAAVMTLK